MRGPEPRRRLNLRRGELREPHFSASPTLMIRTLASCSLLFVYLLLMLLVAAGYLLKMLIDLILSEVVTCFANLSDKLGVSPARR